MRRVNERLWPWVYWATLSCHRKRMKASGKPLNGHQERPTRELQTRLLFISAPKCLPKGFWWYFLINVTDNHAQKLSEVSIADGGCTVLGGEGGNFGELIAVSLCLLFTHKERTNLTYGTWFLSSFKKHSWKKKKEPVLNCLTVQVFLLVLENLSSHSDLLPGMGKTCRRQDFFSPLITHLHKHCLAHT